VDFDPVRAKSEGRDTGLPSDIAALFPDSFVDSELGKIPKGWKVAPLSELIEIGPTRRLSKGQLAKYLDMQNVPTRGHRPVGWIEREFTSGTRFANGDTLMARITPCLENGKTAFVDFLDDGDIGWGSTEFIVLHAKPPLPEAYSYLLARYGVFREFAIQNMTGSSGRQRVPAESLFSYPLVEPFAPVSQAFGDTINPLFSAIKSNSEQMATLTNFRDSLLPKLMSGEIQLQ
jgi:type I restriction enzyme S subunit